MTPAELDSSALKSSVAFTGRLACMTRAEAFEVVRQHGGTPSIVGELGWPLLDDGRPSNKLTLARSYSVPVVSERRFLEWIGNFIPDIPSLHPPEKSSLTNSGKKRAYPRAPRAIVLGRFAIWPKD
jgi:hypothetical protein